MEKVNKCRGFGTVLPTRSLSSCSWSSWLRWQQWLRFLVKNVTGNRNNSAMARHPNAGADKANARQSSIRFSIPSYSSYIPLPILIPPVSHRFIDGLEAFWHLLWRRRNPSRHRRDFLTYFMLHSFTLCNINSFYERIQLQYNLMFLSDKSIDSNRLSRNWWFWNDLF